MSDFINREDGEIEMYENLIEQLRACSCAVSCEACPYGDGGCEEDLMKSAAKAIKELTVQIRNKNALLAETINERPRWIPVAERLPEQNGKYLAFALKEENTMDFCDGHWMLYGIDYRRYVTHWMRIEEPPKEEKGKNYVDVMIGAGLTCKDCYFSKEWCNDESAICEDETGLCERFDPVD